MGINDRPKRMRDRLIEREGRRERRRERERERERESECLTAMATITVNRFLYKTIFFVMKIK